MSSVTITVGDRSFVPSVKDYGVISRKSFLGLVNAPVLTLDDGTQMGIAGKSVMTDVVSAATGKSLDNVTVALPLDVRTIGIDTLTAMGITSEVQATMFGNWRTQLTDAQREAFNQQWMTASTGTPTEKKAFVDKMIASLS